MDTKIIAAVQKAGFTVYMRKTTDSWLIFTDADGKNVGYLQDGWRGLSLGTKHVPNRTTGTGFSLTEFMSPADLTREKLEKAFVVAPGWATSDDVKSVRKWRDIREFMAADLFNGEYGNVPPQPEDGRQP